MYDVEFSNLYILLPSGTTTQRLIRAHHDAPDPPHEINCHITPVSPPQRGPWRTPCVGEWLEPAKGAASKEIESLSSRRGCRPDENEDQED